MIEYRTVCVQRTLRFGPYFFEDFIVCWTRGQTAHHATLVLRLLPFAARFRRPPPPAWGRMGQRQKNV